MAESERRPDGALCTTSDASSEVGEIFYLNQP